MPAAKAENTPIPSSGDPDLIEALDAVAEMLRARGRNAYAIDGENAHHTADQFERWAKHLLVRSAPPNAPPGEEMTAVDYRDWRGVTDFVTKRSKKEHEFVNGTVRDMREAIYSLVESISRTSGAQGKNDVVLRRRIAALGQAVEIGSVELLRLEATAVADAVTKALEEQRLLHEKQNADLKARLESLGEQLEQTRREGDTDPLTRVANRRAFDLALERQLTISRVVGRPVTLFMIDVDHFKSINDTHGHPAGDEVLRALANILSKTFPRRSDLVARYGGEEFTVILPDSGEPEVALLAERMLNAIRGLRVKLPSERTLAITASAGAAIAHPTETAAELIERADKSLYASKRAGRNRWLCSPTPQLSANDQYESAAE